MNERTEEKAAGDEDDKNRNQLYRKRVTEETAWDEKGKSEGIAREEEGLRIESSFRGKG